MITSGIPVWIRKMEQQNESVSRSFQLDKPYYSYDYKKVHFLIMASQSPYNAGTEPALIL